MGTYRVEGCRYIQPQCYWISGHCSWIERDLPPTLASSGSEHGNQAIVRHFPLMTSSIAFISKVNIKRLSKDICCKVRVLKCCCSSSIFAIPFIMQLLFLTQTRGPVFFSTHGFPSFPLSTSHAYQYICPFCVFPFTSSLK